MLLLVRFVAIAIVMAISSGSRALPAVDVLSDEEPAKVINVKQLPKGVKRPAAHQSSADRDYIRRRTARLLGSSCRCSRLAKSARASCFRQFNDMAQPIYVLRVELAELHKLDADQKARSGLKPKIDQKPCQVASAWKSFQGKSFR